MSKEFITVKEASQKRGVTIKYIYDLLANGRLPGAKKINRVWYIPADAVKARGA
jgi:excisionase family DNA binding protein